MTFFIVKNPEYKMPVDSLRREAFGSLLKGAGFQSAGFLFEEVRNGKRTENKGCGCARNPGNSTESLQLFQLSQEDEEIIPSNPVVGILRQLKMETTNRIPEPMNSQEIALFIRTCSEHYPEHYTLFLTGFRTGMRLGELLALHWGDVDWNGRFVHVQRSYTKQSKIFPTKSGKDRRVDVSDQIWEELRRRYLARKKEAFKEGRGDELGEIIFHRNGKYMDQNFIRPIFKKILRIAGIRKVRPHDMRHSYASLLLSNGFSPVYVKE